MANMIEVEYQAASGNPRAAAFSAGRPGTVTKTALRGPRVGN